MQRNIGFRCIRANMLLLAFLLAFLEGALASARASAAFPFRRNSLGCPG